MAERDVIVEFVFDRIGPRAVANAYRILVPERRGRRERRSDDEHSSDLRPGVVGSAEGGPDDRFADGGTARGGRALGA